jgi:hypothetical protein
MGEQTTVHGAFVDSHTVHGKRHHCMRRELPRLDADERSVFTDALRAPAGVGGASDPAEST